MKSSKKNAITGKDMNLIERKTRKGKSIGSRHLLAINDSDHQNDHDIYFRGDSDGDYIVSHHRDSSSDEKALVMSSYFHHHLDTINNNIINKDNFYNMNKHRQLSSSSDSSSVISSDANTRGLNIENNDGKITELPMGFDWRAYLQLNPDLIAAGLITKKLAVDHYLTSGHKENREYTGIVIVLQMDDYVLCAL